MTLRDEIELDLITEYGADIAEAAGFATQEALSVLSRMLFGMDWDELERAQQSR